jgi:hypothetical protein
MDGRPVMCATIRSRLWRKVEQLAGALFDEQQALQARQRLLDEGRSVIDRTRTATEQHAAETLKLNELLQAGAIDQATYARAVEMAASRPSIAVSIRQEPSLPCMQKPIVQRSPLKPLEPSRAEREQL